MAKHTKKPYIITTPRLDSDGEAIPGEYRDAPWGPFDNTGAAETFLRKNKKEGEFRIACITSRVRLEPEKVVSITSTKLPLIDHKPTGGVAPSAGRTPVPKGQK